MRHRFISTNLLIHCIAASAALYYAWLISQSAYVKTGFQFITPVLIIMAVHLLGLAMSRNLSSGFSSVIYKRSAQTAVGMALVIFSTSIVAPQPANAAVSDIAGGVLAVAFCVAVIAIIGGIVAFVIYLFFKAISLLFKRSGSNGPENRLFDFGSLAVSGIFLSVFSLEGHPHSFAFPSGNESFASYHVDATPDQVWRAMEQATSPDFPLPSILSVFPQPTKVVTDEGTALGATRKVAFQGREGMGFLTFKVVERTNAIAVFKALSDTSPYAGWVAHKRLIYKILPEGSGTRLTVSLEYDRLLAPAWFFSPMTSGAAYLAMDVLARDVKTRAEG